jgi:Fic family protein
MQALYDLVNRTKSPYDKALIVLSGSAYIQAFEDGNKRTSRLLTNALLLANGLAPLSYRSVDEEQYRNAMLVFYELNSLLELKKIFKEQYLAATSNYALSI